MLATYSISGRRWLNLQSSAKRSHSQGQTEIKVSLFSPLFFRSEKTHFDAVDGAVPGNHVACRAQAFSFTGNKVKNVFNITCIRDLKVLGKIKIRNCINEDKISDSTSGLPFTLMTRKWEDLIIEG